MDMVMGNMDSGNEEVLMEKMLQKNVWAVVGANRNPEKFGHKIYRKLKEKGYRVYAINPTIEAIESDKCYKDLSSLPEMPDVIDMVVNPEKGKPIIEEAARLGIKNIWLQPGTYDDDLMNLIRERGLNAVRACVLVALH